jgi:hypothetical protein
MYSDTSTTTTHRVPLLQGASNYTVWVEEISIFLMTKAAYSITINASGLQRLKTEDDSTYELRLQSITEKVKDRDQQALGYLLAHIEPAYKETIIGANSAH